MRTQGWPHEFQPQPWVELEAKFAAFADENPQLLYLHDIITSVIAHGKTDALAAITSIHDLVVTSTPVASPPLDVVRVRAPDSVRHGPPAGQVRIEHQSHLGRNDVLERPVREAVALFWRFMIEKFGVTPERPI